MSNDLRIRATLDGQQFENGLTGFAKRLKDLRDQGQQTGKTLSDMLTMPNSGMTYQRQLMKLQKTLADITITYRAMSDEEKNSEFGMQLKQTLDELTAKASEWRDAIGDVQQAINKGASDTLYFDALAQGMQLASSALQTFAGIAGMSKGNVEALTNAIAKMKTIEAATGTVIKTINALQKNQSSIMQVVAIVQNKAAAAAARQAAATGTATIAQRAFNVVAKANPYVLLASAIIAVGTALFMFAKNQNKAKEEEAAQQKRIEAQKKAFDDYSNAVASSASKLFTIYNKLRVEYSKLTTQLAKTKWIKENKSNFDSLGIAIKTVSDAENAFVKNTDKMIKSFSLRAKAAAYGKLAEDAYAEVIKRDEYLSSKKVKVGDKSYTSSVTKDANSNTYNNGTLQYSQTTGAYHYTEKGAKEYNENLKKSDAATYQYTKKAEGYVNQMIALEAEASNLLKSVGVQSYGNDGKGDELKALDGSIAAYEKKISELKDKQNKLSKNSSQYQEYDKEIKAYQEKIDAIKNLSSKADIEAKVSKQLIEISGKRELGILNEVDAIQEEISTYKSWNTSIINAAGSIDKLTQADKEQISSNLNEITVKSKLIDKLKEEQKLRDYHVSATDLGKVSSEKQDTLKGVRTYEWNQNDRDTKVKDAEKAYDDLKKQIDKLSSTYEILSKKQEEGFELNANDTAWLSMYNDKITTLEELKNAYDEAVNSAEKFNKTQGVISAVEGSISAVNSFVSSIDSVYRTFKNMDEELENAENGWETFMVYMNAAMSVFNSVIGVIDMMNNITKISTFFTTLSAGAKTKEASATIALASAETAEAASRVAATTATATNTAATTADTTAKAANAVAGAASSQSGIPIVGPILAGIAVAGIIALLLTSMAKFADGGIVSGAKSVGDFNIARVNGGEMILNTTQQKRLWNVLDGQTALTSNSNGNGKVEFEISGDRLKGVLKNYESKRAKI